MNTCPSCNNDFVQPFVCTTCGAEKLYDATVTSLRQQLASRDAEVAELKKEVADHHFSWAGCSQQLKDVCKDLEEIEQERDQLREHVTLLRDVLKSLHWMDANIAIRKALAATESKP